MMKKRINFKLFVFFFLQLILFISCQSEEILVEHNHLNYKGYKTEYLKGADAQNAIEKLKNKLNSKSKLIVISTDSNSMRTNGGIIDFNNILMVMDTLGIKNYTFKIINHPNDDLKTFHNLVLTEKDNSFEVTVMKYIMSDQFFQEYYAGIKEFNEFQGRVSALSLSPENPCEDVVVEYPGDGPPGGGGPGDGPPGDGPPGDGGPGGGGSSDCFSISLSFGCSCGNSFSTYAGAFGCATSGNGNYTITIVITYSIASDCRIASDPCNPNGGIGIIPIQVQKTPCSELKTFYTNNAIQQTLRILKAQSSGQSEHGNYISETTNSAGASYLSFPVIPADPNNPTSLNLSAGVANGNVKGAMHCHTDPVSTNAVPMFSPADLKCLLDIARYHSPINNNPKDYSEYTVMLSVGSGHYALKFKNYNSFLQNFNANFANFDIDLNLLYNNSLPTANSTILIKDFLKALNKNNLSDVGLYKATETTNSNGVSNITGWKEQTLDASGNIIEIPCI
jgi:hypothetical protein